MDIELTLPRCARVSAAITTICTQHWDATFARQAIHLHPVGSANREAEETARVGAEAEAEETRLRFDDARNKRGLIDNEFYSVLPFCALNHFD